MEFLRLVLVDDEPIILRGLLETYEWEQMGFEIVGTAMSGQAAMELIRSEKPDVVLTDIRMKKMTGLEVMEEIKKENEETVFIFLSAYRDFSYAQKALEMGAFSYLLKPVEEDKLQETMAEAHRFCMEQKANKKEQEVWKQLLEGNSDNFLQTIIQRYIKGQIEREMLEEVFALLNHTVEETDRFLSICVNVDISYKITNQLDYDAARLALFAYLEEQLKPLYLFWSFDAPSDNKVFLVRLPEGVKVGDIRVMMQKAHKVQKCEVISAISRIGRGYEGMRQCYEDSLQLFEIASASGAGAFTVSKEIARGAKTYSADRELLIVNAVRKNDAESLKKVFVDFIFSLPEQDGEQILFVHTMMLQIEAMLRKSYGFDEEMEGRFREYYTTLCGLPAARTIDVTYKFLQTIIEERKKNTDTKELEYFTEYMSVAIAYIEEHLDDEELSIVSVAARIYLNPVYFGRVFKRTYQMTFKQYLQQQRMEKAKRLILGGMESMGEVCEKVGIGNPSYFSQLFKQYTGVLPSEYRKHKER